MARTDTERLDLMAKYDMVRIPRWLEYWKKEVGTDTTTHSCEVASIPTTLPAREQIDAALDYFESGAGNQADRVPAVGTWIGR